MTRQLDIPLVVILCISVVWIMWLTLELLIYIFCVIQTEMQYWTCWKITFLLKCHQQRCSKIRGHNSNNSNRKTASSMWSNTYVPNIPRSSAVTTLKKGCYKWQPCNHTNSSLNACVLKTHLCSSHASLRHTWKKIKKSRTNEMTLFFIAVKPEANDRF